MNSYKKSIEKIAKKYGLQMVYVFGSRSKEALDLIEGRKMCFDETPSDLDVGVKSERNLSVAEKVEIAIFFEDLFNLPRVDVVVLDEAPVFLAFEIVTGDMLYCRDDIFEANYQLYIMAQAADMRPYQQMKFKMILGG
jgi:predicted nucleotidyltransferase